MGRRRLGFRVLGPYRREDGRYSVAVRGPGLEGGTDSKQFYYGSEAEALTAKKAIAAELQQAEDATLAEAVERYLAEELQANRQLKASTISEARARLNPLIRLAPELAADVRPEHIRERLAQLPSAASQRGTLARTNDFFAFAVAARLVRANPCVGVGVKAKAPRGKDTLTRSEARALDDRLWTEVDSSGVEAEVAAAVLVLLHLGLRRSELLRLQVRDVDLGSPQPVVSVERQAKSATGYRDVEVPTKVAGLLRSLVEGKALTAWLWPSAESVAGHRGETWLLKGTHRMCRLAGVAEVCPQGLRGTHSKLARQAGQTAHAIQAQLGHEDARTSVQSYIGEEVEAQERTRLAQSTLSGSKGPQP